MEWLPKKQLFNGAIWQDLRIESQEPDGWAGKLLDWVGVPGEKGFAGGWRSHTEIWQQGRPGLTDNGYQLGKKLSTVPMVGWAVGRPRLGWGRCFTEIVEKVRSLWTLAERQGEAGVRPTTGLLCRYRGSSTTEVRNWFTEVWQLRLSF